MIWAALLALVLGGGGFLISQIRIAQWRAKANPDAASQVSDPAEAAVVTLVALAALDGVFTEQQKSAMHRQLTLVMKIPERDVEDLIARGLWIVGQRPNPEVAINRVLPVLESNLSPEETHQLLSMARAVANAEGGSTTEMQERELRKLSSRLLQLH